jgi:O-antigen ligase
MKFAFKLRSPSRKNILLGGGRRGPGFAGRHHGTKYPVPGNHDAQRLDRGNTAASKSRAELPWRWFLGLLLLHVILASLMKRWPLLASLHAALTLLIALVLAVRNASPAKLVAFMAYLIGSEVLWRMTQAAVPWEFGKYALVLIALVAMARRPGFSGVWLPLLYFSLLVPSAFLTLGSGDFSQVRQEISFNLSGPFSLTVLMLYFLGIRLKLAELGRVFQFMLLPIAGVCSIVAFTVLTNDNIVFDDRSNNLASGGAPANQVSAILGLAVFTSLLYSLGPGQTSKKRAWLLAFTVLFFAQCVMTFSRTGVYLAAVSMLAVIIMLSSDVKRLLTAVGGLCLLAAVIAFLVWPALNHFTGGALSQRFAKTTSTGRDQIVKGDLELFVDHPLLGVGVGRAREERSEYIGHETNAHTEFSRLLAEHGCLGLFALFTLLFIVGENIWRERFSYRGAVVAGAVVWSLLFMLVSGMRLAAPSFLIGLSCVRWSRSNQVARRPKTFQPVLRSGS